MAVVSLSLWNRSPLSLPDALGVNGMWGEGTGKERERNGEGSGRDRERIGKGSGRDRERIGKGAGREREKIGEG